ncbi:MAG TPA: hypothetical protein VI997_12125 [Candidatus Thermoplasmatota archaeon]|nr:hypothetical protein [Candidatus Thermoplasmatota archaeon]
MRPGARVALLTVASVALFYALATLGTRDDPYAPNEWLFSHVHLARIGLAEGEVPWNQALLGSNSASESWPAFRDEAGLPRPTFFASTTWHFWNGLPLQPALLASLSALAGLDPEDAARLPLAGGAVVLLAFATADLLVARSKGSDTRYACAAPFLAAAAAAPFVLDMRVLMPSAALVAVGIALHLFARRALVGERRALALAVAPLVLLPFWYYTLAYFVILLFGAFLAVRAGLRLSGRRDASGVPTALMIAVPCAMLVALAANGSLATHVGLADSGGVLGETPVGADYGSHLNRDLWRSALLYAALGAFFAPLFATATRAAIGRSDGPAADVLTPWAAGGAAFGLALHLTVGVSFLNRVAIYLAPAAAVAAASLLALRRVRAASVAAGGAVAVVATAALVATAAPSYGPDDAAAFSWMEAAVPSDAGVYGSLDATGVLFRAHGFRGALAFPPNEDVLEVLWYGEDPERMIPWLASVDYVVLRDDARTRGFEEFGPLREPVSAAAYTKFARSEDLDLVYDGGGVQVFRVDLRPELVRTF